MGRHPSKHLRVHFPARPSRRRRGNTVLIFKVSVRCAVPDGAAITAEYCTANNSQFINNFEQLKIQALCGY